MNGTIVNASVSITRADGSVLDLKFENRGVEVFDSKLTSMEISFIDRVLDLLSGWMMYLEKEGAKEPKEVVGNREPGDTEDEPKVN